MKLFKRSRHEQPRRRQLERQPTVDTEDTTAFRRGRTLTGSASSLVRTANESQADLKSSRVHAHELRKVRRRVTLLFAAAALVAVGLYALISQFTAQVVVQASPDPSIQLEPVYMDAIDAYLTDHPSERLRFLINTERLAEYLQKTVAPEVTGVAVEGGFGFGASLFRLTFREPIAGWEVNGQELYVDAAGIPFGRNYFEPPSLRISDESGMSSTTPGESIMSNRFMGYIGQVIGLSKEQGFIVSRIVIPRGMTRQIDVHLEGVDYPVKFSSDRPAGESVDDMARTIGWMRSHQRAPQYIDVRVDGRVFYK